MKFYIFIICSIISIIHAKITANQVMQIKEDFWRENRAKMALNLPSSRNNPQTCEAGSVEIDGQAYPCNKVDFFSFISRSELTVTRPEFTDSFFNMADLWGWLSPQGREFTLTCMTNVLWFIDSTDPVDPQPVAYIESHRAESHWCDVKVYKDVAYIVQDRLVNGGNDRGIQVVDLTRLETDEILNSPDPVVLEPDFTYAEHGAAHNVVIDVDSGFLFNVGISGGTSCSGGLHMVDLTDPLEPVFAGCFNEDGYTHDAQCVIYSGPDTPFVGREICFAYNEDTVTIVDVTEKSDPVLLSRTTYPTATYVHQGWLSPGQDFLVVNDEVDEISGAIPDTRSYILDITSLEDPIFKGSYSHEESSIDHNLYFWGEMYFRGWTGSGSLEVPPNRNFVYCANYAAGLRIIDATNISQPTPQLEEIGFFDIAPTEVGDQFLGAWSSYMHPSGVIAVTGMESGLFFLNFTEAFDVVSVVAPEDDQDQNETVGDQDENDQDQNETVGDQNENDQDQDETVDFPEEDSEEEVSNGFNLILALSSCFLLTGIFGCQ